MVIGRAFLWLVASTALLSCTTADQSTIASRWKGAVDTAHNGTIRVLNPAEGVWAETEMWRIVEAIRIGRTEGEGPDIFGRITAVAVSPSGSIVVIDGAAQELRVFDHTGQYIRTIGRKGSGPGEFRSAYGLAWDAAGRLWVIDPGNNRYTVFDSSGTYLFDRRRQVPGVVHPWLGVIGEDWHIYDIAPREDPDGRRLYTICRVDTIGNLTDSLPKLEYRPQITGGMPMALFGVTPRLTFRLDNKGYVWFGITSEYRIVQRRLTGDTVRIIERALSPVRVTAQEKDSIRREIAATAPEFAHATIPDTKPAFDRLFPQDDGYLFVQPMTRREDFGRIFDVFDPDGRYLGQAYSNVQFVTFPVMPTFTRDHVYGLATDSLGVQYVVRARIEKGRL